MKFDFKYEHNGTVYGLMLVEKNTAIQVFKDNVKAYLIKADWCTCAGYKYRRKCNHMTNAEGSGLLKRLVKEPPKESTGMTSQFITESRRKSITEYGKKNNWGKAMIEWAIVRMDEFVRRKQGADDMVKAFNKQRRRAK